MSNGFLSQKALVNNLYRHYTREGLKEAHKVLGGAGPAVASVRAPEGTWLACGMPLEKHGVERL